ncbi:hypothetical protein AQUCO_03500058v1 [Aquilegia coerulea]|uniref:RING-type E3 ubiquitin transferase n=1 Tax=Aquilegia coerulea TaxID=218851 RepID=A0A2G5CWV8_AQUCA|nr:hypothetical protein AQUCO_03500058v1 [Aquilegia coerulea]PIA35418.1 hypothetical protein AQUCO_03500058v1 [Aquilegia coerulea]PIA35419.1 hypothetical protein AQUCO_03500058v1 [Aquilegia coerulea]PIA35420.1 hypothetical protein AQUCO_03500058v1 [Aquilegia coerulea]
MSSTAGNTGGGGGTNQQQYFCYQCNRTVLITTSPTSDLVCPSCDGGFLEEYENPNPNPPNPNPLNSIFSALFAPDSPPHHHHHHGGAGGGGGGGGGSPYVFSSSSSSGAAGSMDINQDPFAELAALFGSQISRRSSSASAVGPEPDPFNPFQFLTNYLQTIRPGGANIQFVFENNNNNPTEIGVGFGGLGAGTGGFRFPASFGDYVIGPGLEQIIQQLAENDPNRYGTPPASKSVVQGLPDVKITNELLKSDSSQCAVCKDEFELGMDAKQMPCKHIYHPDCILPWLELHNSCPVCRYELPTDDPDYENRTEGSQSGSANQQPPITVDLGALGSNTNAGVGVSGGGGTAAAGATQDNSPSARSRGFTISFGWPFRGRSGASAETSNSGVGGNSGNNNNSGGSNSGNQGNPNFGNETMDESLD